MEPKLMNSYLSKIIRLVHQKIHQLQIGQFFMPNQKRGRFLFRNHLFLTVLTVVFGVTILCSINQGKADQLNLFNSFNLLNFRHNPLASNNNTLSPLNRLDRNSEINIKTISHKDQDKLSFKSVSLKDDTNKYEINQFIATAVDPQAQFNDDYPPQKPLENLNFTPNNAHTIRLGFTKNAYWMRATITNQSQQKKWLLEVFPSSLDHVDVYLPKSGDWLLKRNGRVYPFQTREIKDYRFVIPINIEKQTTQTIYLRIATETSLIFQANLWEPHTFWQNRHQSQLLQGVVYGIFAFAILYNLFLSISLWDLSYYYFVLFVLALSLGYLAWDGLGFQYIWSENVVWNRLSVPISLDILSISIIGFTTHFLEIHRNRKHWYLILKIIFFCAITGIVITSFASYRISILLSNVILSTAALSSFTIGILAWRKNSRRSITIFLFAWGLLLLTASVGIFTNLFAFVPLPLSFVELVKYNGVFIVIALSFALADRINHLRDQVLVQQKASLQLKDELNHLLTQRQDKLEQLVKERTQALIEAKEIAEAANRAKSSFLSNMSHELRTPMNSVLGFVQLLQMASNLKPEQQKILATISASGHHLLSLINDVLDMSRIESGQISLKLSPFYLPVVIEEVQEIFLVKARNKQIKLRANLIDDLPQVLYGDELKLRQILINLLNNAIKFTDSGEVSLSVTQLDEANSDVLIKAADWINIMNHNVLNHELEAEEIKGKIVANICLRFMIQDTGIGISELDLSKLFVPFFQAENNLIRKDGTGLGLAISSRLVKTMRGNINVTSIPRVGTTFIVDLPFGLVAVEPENSNYNRNLGSKLSQHKTKITNSNNFSIFEVADDSQTDSQIDYKINYEPIKNDAVYRFSESQLKTQNQQQEKHSFNFRDNLSHWQNIKQDIKILIAEDNPVNRSLILIMLQELGYRSISTATNGSEVMNAVAKEKYDLILMDINMPQMDGLEATRQIIANYGDLRPTIIAVTANALEEDRAKCFAVGVDDYLSKPLRINTLKQVLKERFNIS